MSLTLHEVRLKKLLTWLESVIGCSAGVVLFSFYFAELTISYNDVQRLIMLKLEILFVTELLEKRSPVIFGAFEDSDAMVDCTRHGRSSLKLPPRPNYIFTSRRIPFSFFFTSFKSSVLAVLSRSNQFAAVVYDVIYCN